jgi:hypothetical protein
MGYLGWIEYMLRVDRLYTLAFSNQTISPRIINT